MDSRNYYNSLKKPSWAPPTQTFGIVWSILYIIIFLTFGFVASQLFTGEIPLVVGIPFALVIISNALFTTFQFRLRNQSLALIDIIVNISSLIWAMILVYPYAPWVMWLNVPHALWLVIATSLQFYITMHNRTS